MSERTSQSQNRSAGGPPNRGGPGTIALSTEKAQNFGKTIKALLAYLQPFRPAIIAVIIFAIASTAFAIVSPRILGNMTNTIVDGFTDGRDYDRIVDQLPPGTTIAEGTTGAQVLALLPPDAREAMSDEQRNRIATRNSLNDPASTFLKSVASGYFSWFSI